MFKIRFYNIVSVIFFIIDSSGAQEHELLITGPNLRAVSNITYIYQYDDQSRPFFSCFYDCQGTYDVTMSWIWSDKNGLKKQDFTTRKRTFDLFDYITLSFNETVGKANDKDSLTCMIEVIKEANGHIDQIISQYYRLREIKFRYEPASRRTTGDGEPVNTTAVTNKDVNKFDKWFVITDCIIIVLVITVLFYTTKYIIQTMDKARSKLKVCEDIPMHQINSAQSPETVSTQNQERDLINEHIYVNLSRGAPYRDDPVYANCVTVMKKA